MNEKLKNDEDFSRNLDEKTDNLLSEVYQEIKKSETFLQQENESENALEDDKNRTEVVQFRVSKKELEIIDRRLENSPYKSRSSYLRDCALNAFVVNYNLKNIDSYLREVGHIGNNINQIAVRVNSGGVFFKEDIMDIKRGLGMIWQRLKFMESEVHSVNQSNISLTLGKPEAVRFLLVMVAALLQRMRQLNLKLSESKEADGANSSHNT